MRNRTETPMSRPYDGQPVEYTPPASPADMESIRARIRRRVERQNQQDEAAEYARLRRLAGGAE